MKVEVLVEKEPDYTRPPGTSGTPGHRTSHDNCDAQHNHQEQPEQGFLVRVVGVVTLPEPEQGLRPW